MLRPVPGSVLATPGRDMSEVVIHPWHSLPSRPSSEANTIHVVIEIPRGSKVKYELDKPTGLLRLDRVLHSSVIYPANYGFIPRTYAPDEDPLDALILCSEPVVPLSIVVGRPIGLMRMLDMGKLDDKIIAVTAEDPAFADYTDIAQLPRHLMREMGRFFLDYKKLEEKEVSVEEPLGVREAEQVIVEAIELYRQKENALRGWK